MHCIFGLTSMQAVSWNENVGRRIQALMVIWPRLGFFRQSPAVEIGSTLSCTRPFYGRGNLDQHINGAVWVYAFNVSAGRGVWTIASNLVYTQHAYPRIVPRLSIICFLAGSATQK